MAHFGHSIYSATSASRDFGVRQFLHEVQFLIGPESDLPPLSFTPGIQRPQGRISDEAATPFSVHASDSERAPPLPDGSLADAPPVSDRHCRFMLDSASQFFIDQYPFAEGTRSCVVAERPGDRCCTPTVHHHFDITEEARGQFANFQWRCLVRAEQQRCLFLVHPDNHSAQETWCILTTSAFRRGQ